MFPIKGTAGAYYDIQLVTKTFFSLQLLEILFLRMRLCVKLKQTR